MISYLTLDPHARVSCEVVAAGELFVITGEITTSVTVDISKVVRDTLKEIGYNKISYLDPDACSILISVNEQSPDIAKGVDKALEMKDGLIGGSLNIGAGDQGIVFGFACNETPEYMPLPISLAHKLAQRLDKVRLDKDIPYIGPDGETQVTIEYDNGVPLRIDTVIVSIQHMVDVDLRELREDIWHHVIVPTLPENLLDERTKYLLNPTGRFVLGGPVADKGLKGRKIIVDTYGGAAHHGGGAFSGKDATKVDRSELSPYNWCKFSGRTG
ncbi:methionine adenosyltransferase [Alicyclobacillus sp. ALC3]|nr:methionine adenosyltransferase [Alicyclobacillus sp. ALC3]